MDRFIQQSRRTWTGLHAVATVLLLALCGCATKAPVDQIKYFNQAFSAVNTVGQPLLDDLAIAERQVGKAAALNKAKNAADGRTNGACKDGGVNEIWAESRVKDLGYVSGYCLENATYYSTLGDPIATASIRAGLKVIERYADTLAALTDGRNAEQALGEVAALSQEVDGLAALFGASTVAGPFISALQPVLSIAVTKANADEARRAIIDGAPKVSSLIQGLRTAVPSIFTVLITENSNKAKDAQLAPAAIQAIETRRIEVSVYVTLLDRLQKAWDLTVDAARNPGSPRLTDVVAQTAALRADAEILRKSLAALRNGAVALK